MPWLAEPLRGDAGSRVAHRRARAVVVRARAPARTAGRAARAGRSRGGGHPHGAAPHDTSRCTCARCSCRRRCAIRRRCARWCCWISNRIRRRPPSIACRCWSSRRPRACCSGRSSSARSRRPSRCRRCWRGSPRSMGERHVGSPPLVDSWKPGAFAMERVRSAGRRRPPGHERTRPIRRAAPLVDRASAGVAAIRLPDPRPRARDAARRVPAIRGCAASRGPGPRGRAGGLALVRRRESDSGIGGRRRSCRQREALAHRSGEVSGPPDAGAAQPPDLVRVPITRPGIATSGTSRWPTARSTACTSSARWASGSSRAC